MTKPKILIYHFSHDPEEFDIDRFDAFAIKDRTDWNGAPSLVVPLTSGKMRSITNRILYIPQDHFKHKDVYFMIDNVKYKFPNKSIQEIYKILSEVIYEKIVEYQLSVLNGQHSSV